MRLPTALLAILVSSASAHAADCAVSKIEAALSASLSSLKVLERDVTDVQSTEGGVWQIYREADGRVNSIVRVDGGESGMAERRLSIVNRRTYGIAVTRVDYLRHAFIEDAGPNGTAKRTTDYFYFCEGKLLLPPADYFMGDIKDYESRGIEAQNGMLKDKDVADFTKGLARP
jgi:hypothetical protein